MEIALINPPASNGLRCIREGRCEQRAESFQYLMVPISLPSIASLLLRDEFEVRVIDCIADGISIDKLRQVLRKDKPMLSVVNVATLSYHTDKDVADLCRELSIPVAAYGVHVTAKADETLRDTNFDFVIRGEPEFVVLALARALREHVDIGDVLGVSHKSNGKVVHNNPASPQGNLDAMPFPSRNLMPNEKYTAPLYRKPYTLVISSRGCPFECIYCTAHQYYGRKPRFRSPQNVMAEIRHVVTKIGIRHIAMWSDTFTLRKEFVLELCKRIKQSELDFEWYCNSRVDTVDEEMIEAMAEANCRIMTFGVESFEQRVLDLMNKGITPEQTRRAIALCRKYEIRTQAHLIFGLPGENHESIAKTINGVIEADPDYAEFYCAVPFPGTKFYKLATEKNYLTTKQYSRYELNQAIVSYPNLSSAEVKKAMTKAYRKFYLRPSYIFRKATELPISQWPTIAGQAISWVRDWILG
jgi:anaerobic magnesium-protoporphyrin IX monomethyl ester cyclase